VLGGLIATDSSPTATDPPSSNCKTSVRHPMLIELFKLSVRRKTSHVTFFGSNDEKTINRLGRRLASPVDAVGPPPGLDLRRHCGFRIVLVEPSFAWDNKIVLSPERGLRAATLCRGTERAKCSAGCFSLR
jgi:hypothetical protein